MHTETDRMTILSQTLQARDLGTLEQFIRERYDNGRSWDDIALDLRDALRGTIYRPPRESVIKYAQRYGIRSYRPPGMARPPRFRQESD